LLRRCLGGNRSPATHFGQLIYATHKLDVFLPLQGFSEFSSMVPLSSKVGDLRIGQLALKLFF
jgi:hypothetical protein